MPLGQRGFMKRILRFFLWFVATFLVLWGIFGILGGPDPGSGAQALTKVLGLVFFLSGIGLIIALRVWARWDSKQ